MFVLFSMCEAGNPKCRRKETWERLHRRHVNRCVMVKHTKPVWVPIEGGQYQTASDQPKRPNRLPLTSECHLEKIVFELPSPTAISLNDDDLSSELTCKSSSAPHLIKSTQTLLKSNSDGTKVLKLKNSKNKTTYL